VKTEAAINEFIQSRIAGDRSPLTIKWYCQRLYRFARSCPELPQKPEPIEAHLASLDCSPAEKQNHFNALRAFYRFLRKRHKLANPIDLVERPRGEEKKRATLEAEELWKLLYSAANLRDKAILTLLIDTGMRSSELAGLRKQDIKLDTVTVRGKTGEREIPISEDTRRLLAALMAQDEKGEAVFYSHKGQPMTRNSVYRTVSTHMRKAGIQGPKLGAHRIRHAFGKGYLVSGGDLRSLQNLMGHRRITTTEKYAELNLTDITTKHHQFTPLRAAHTAAQESFFDKAKAVEEAEAIVKGE